jgi:hypothetical protein
MWYMVALFFGLSLRLKVGNIMVHGKQYSKLTQTNKTRQSVKTALQHRSPVASLTDNYRTKSSQVRTMNIIGAVGKKCKVINGISHANVFSNIRY